MFKLPFSLGRSRVVRLPEGTELPKKETRYPFLALIAFVFLALVAFVFVFADLLAPYDYREQALLNRLAAPVFLCGTRDHILGTDELVVRS